MKLLKILASTGTAEILLLLRTKPHFFGDITKFLKYDRLSTSSSLATRRLKSLEKLCLVSRKVKQDRKRRVQYSLTADGNKIARILIELEKMDKKLHN